MDRNIRFQIVDITAGDETDYSLTDDDKEEKNYIIHMYGRAMNGDSVHAKIVGFKPYFYIKVPDNFGLIGLKNHLGNKMRNPDGLIDCKMLKRYDYYGFNNYKPETFIKFICQSYNATFDVKNVLDKARLILGSRPMYYEAKLAPFLRFLHEREIKPAGWVHIKKWSDCFTSKCSIDIQCNANDIESYITNDIAPLVCSSFDIECYSGDHSRIPDPEFIEDVVTQIGTTTNIYGSKDGEIKKHIITLKSCAPIDGVTVESYETEEDVLIAWIKHIDSIDPDIITGYNIYGFDFKYLYRRAEKLGIKTAFSNTSRIKRFESDLKSKTLSSSAMGFNEMYYMDSPGRLLIDLYKVVQRDYKFESYKLDNVAGEFIKGKIKKVNVGKRYTWLTVDNVNDIEVGNYIGITIDKLNTYHCEEQSKFCVRKIDAGKLVIEGQLTGLEDLSSIEWTLKKDDISVKDIFAFQNIDAEHRSVIATYCIQDNILCNKLLDKLQVLSNNIAMANICYVPMSYLFLRGQGIKAYSLIAKQCMDDKFLIPDIENRASDNDKYQGAIVLEANPGGYFNPVVVNDFASLYPSSIISHNLSPDTLITKKTGDCLYPTQKIQVSDTQSYNFILPDTEYDGDEALRPRRGIIPRVLISLLAARKATRKRMATETDIFQRFILEGRQLSYKLVANSIYGNLGSSFGSVACKPVAEACTSVGRQLLQFARDTAKEVYPDCKIVYGDSVTGDTPLLLQKDDGSITIKTIETLGTNWFDYRIFKEGQQDRHDKQQDVCNYKVWTSNGWSEIKRVIRHRCKKELFRVNTDAGCVDVTEDHSLLTMDKAIIKSKDLIVGETKLLQHYPLFVTSNLKLDELMNHNNISDKESFIKGFFYNCPSWALDNANKELLEQIKEWAESIYNTPFKILETMESSGVYKLVPTKIIKHMIDTYRPLFYDTHKFKIVPDDILNGSEQTRLDFMKGYYAADGDKCTGVRKSIRMDNNGKIGTAQLNYLLKSLGLHTSICIRSDKPSIYRINTTSNIQRENVNTIKKIVNLGVTDDFVYDLETEVGNFQAGIGTIIVKNTDSLMVEYLQVPKGAKKEEKEEILKKSMDCGKEVEKIVSAKLPWPHNFEYEKCYFPYILYSKKRYSGVMYSNNPKKYDKIDNKGIVLQRRDNAKIVKISFQGALEAILFKQSPDEAFGFVNQTITDMCNGVYEKEYLAVTKTYKKTATGTHNDTVLALREKLKFNPAHEEANAKLQALGDKLKTELGHITMIRRMKERGDTSIQYNDRVPYIYIKLDKEQERMLLESSGRKTLLQGDRMETPTFIEENNLNIDYAHYIEKQIAKPLLQLLAIFEPDDDTCMQLEDLDKKLEYKEKQLMKRFFKPMIQRETLKQRGIKSIDSFFSK